MVLTASTIVSSIRMMQYIRAAEEGAGYSKLSQYFLGEGMCTHELDVVRLLTVAFQLVLYSLVLFSRMREKRACVRGYPSCMRYAAHPLRNDVTERKRLSIDNDKRKQHCAVVFPLR